MTMLLFLIIFVSASEERETITCTENSDPNILENIDPSSILVKIEEENTRRIGQNYIGVNYNGKHARWVAYRWSRNERKTVHNGYFKDEETAAHASDTLARKLIANGEHSHKLNFPDDDTEVYLEKTSNYIGVYYMKRDAMWRAQRHSKNENKTISNGTFKNEETAACASDTLTRKLIANGEKGHKLNFPNEETEVYAKTRTSDYIGVSYHKQNSVWRAQRRSKNEKTMVHNGTYKDEETAAHASDTLAKTLIANGENGHKLNFPDDDIEVFPKEKRTNRDCIGVSYNRNRASWIAQRWSKNEHKTVFNGASYKDEESAARASDTLARKLIANGEKGHILHFPDDDTKNQRSKRKRHADCSQLSRTSQDKF